MKSDGAEHNDNDDTECSTSHQHQDDQTDLLIYMDSNRKYVDWRKFWTLRGTEKHFCGSLLDVERHFREETRTPKYILLHVGVNDIDTRTPEQVSEHLRAILQSMKKKFNRVQIIVSEITPRNDDKDENVKRCNELINSICKDKDYITIARHSNLRNDDWSLHEDVKHISESATPRLVSNIKRALRKAYGITADGSKPRVSNSGSTSNKHSVDSRLQRIAGYPGLQNNQPSVSKNPGHLADPNIVLMQLAQLLRLVTPT